MKESLNDTINEQVGIIVLNYNDCDRTKKLVNRLNSYSLIKHIVVVDNSSTDDSFENLLEAFRDKEKIKIIRTPKNGGYAQGNNFGFKYLIKEYRDCRLVLFSNTDICISEKSLNDLVSLFINLERNTKVGVIAPLNDKISPLNCQPIMLPTFKQDIENMLFPFKKKHVKNLHVNDACKFDQMLLPTEIISGAFFLVSVDTFKSVKGFDERTFLYGEERILAYKLKKLNCKNYIATNVVFVHEDSGVTDKYLITKQKFKYLYDSRLVYWRYYDRVSKVDESLYKLVALFSLLGISILSDLQRFLRRF